MTFKEQVYNVCNEIIHQRITSLLQALADLKESASNETKSTAGDKHETALAMLQIEQKNTNNQLENFLSQKHILHKIDPAVKPVHITSGALVKTNKGYFFLSIPLGKIVVDGTTVTTLSPLSPLGSKLLRLKVNDLVNVNGMTYKIESIE